MDRYSVGRGAAALGRSGASMSDAGTVLPIFAMVAVADYGQTTLREEFMTAPAQ